METIEKLTHSTVIAGSLLIALLLVGSSLFLGRTPVSPAEVARAIIEFDDMNYDHLVVVTSRIPRAIYAIVVGGSLGIAGVLMQSVTRNPVADTGLLGVDAGALFTVTLVFAVFGAVSPLMLFTVAFIGALMAALVVATISTYSRQSVASMSLILAGVSVSAVLGGIVTMISLLDRRTFGQVLHWGIGNIINQPLSDLAYAAPFLCAGILIAVLVSGMLDVLELGDDTARALGSPVLLPRLLSILAIAMLAGTTTALVGLVGFVGLIVPHIARVFRVNDIRPKLVVSALLGVALVSLSDSVGRLSPIGEIPLGILMPIIGVPMLLWVANHQRVVW